eukprot:3351632-Prorocentrum_lima.AAC.1
MIGTVRRWIEPAIYVGIHRAAARGSDDPSTAMPGIDAQPRVDPTTLSLIHISEPTRLDVI